VLVTVRVQFKHELIKDVIHVLRLIITLLDHQRHKGSIIFTVGMYYLYFPIKELAINTVFRRELEPDFRGCPSLAVELFIDILECAESA